MRVGGRSTAVSPYGSPRNEEGYCGTRGRRAGKNADGVSPAMDGVAGRWPTTTPDSARSTFAGWAPPNASGRRNSDTCERSTRAGNFSLSVSATANTEQIPHPSRADHGRPPCCRRPFVRWRSIGYGRAALAAGRRTALAFGGWMPSAVPSGGQDRTRLRTARQTSRPSSTRHVSRSLLLPFQWPRMYCSPTQAPRPCGDVRGATRVTCHGGATPGPAPPRPAFRPYRSTGTGEFDR